LFFAVLGFEHRTYNFEPLHQAIFCDGFFRDRVSRTICPGWLQTAILLTSASGVAKITGMGYGTWLGAGIDPRAKHMLCH
jgi:hypothetical protein